MTTLKKGFRRILFILSHVGRFFGLFALGASKNKASSSKNPKRSFFSFPWSKVEHNRPKNTGFSGKLITEESELAQNGTESDVFFEDRAFIEDSIKAFSSNPPHFLGEEATSQPFFRECIDTLEADMGADHDKVKQELDERVSESSKLLEEFKRDIIETARDQSKADLDQAILGLQEKLERFMALQNAKYEQIQNNIVHFQRIQRLSWIVIWSVLAVVSIFLTLLYVKLGAFLSFP